MSDQTTTITAVPVWTLGERLHKARTTAGVSIEDMAADIGRTDRTVRNYENDSTTVPLLVLRQYALRCGVPVEWLQGGDSMPEHGVTLRIPHVSGRLAA